MASIDNTRFNLPACGGEFEFTLSGFADTDRWTIRWNYPNDDVQLVFDETTGLGDATVKVTVLPRCGDDDDGTNFGILRNGSAFTTVQVNQYATPREDYVNVSVDRILLNPLFKSQTITIEGSEWFAYFTGSSDFQISQNTGEDIDTVTISYTGTTDFNTNLIISSGCDTKTIPLRYLSKIPKNLTISAPVGGGELTLDIEEPFSEWTIAKLPNWAYVSDGKIYVKQNINIVSRTGDILILTPIVDYTVTITQSPLEVWNQGLVNFSNEGGTTEDPIRYNLKPNSITFQYDDRFNCDYFLLDNAGGIIVTAEAAGGNLDLLREIRSTLVYDDGVYRLNTNVYQSGNNYSVNGPGSAPTYGGTAKIYVSSSYTLRNYDYVEMSYGEATINWKSDTELEVICVIEPNGGEIRDILPMLKSNVSGFNPIPLTMITQDGFDWKLQSDQLLLDTTNSYGGPVYNSLSYTSSSKLDDLEFDISYLYGGYQWITALGYDEYGSISVTASDNRYGVDRSAIISVYCPKYNATREFTVIQYGGKFNWDSLVDEVSIDGGTATFNYSSTNSLIKLNDITVQSDLGWSFVEGQTGSITFSVPANDGSLKEYRPSIYVGDKELVSFVIIQGANEIIIETQEIILESEVDSATLYIETTSSWTVDVDVDWIAVTPFSGTGERYITIIADANKTNANREGYVYITNGVDTERIKVIQLRGAAELYFKEKYIKMPLEGGTVYVTLISNIDWTTKWETQ